ncbi:uncharacterized protein LOC18053036 [Citrus clementina]|uniref:uncharacterized protein LOC18053036 n=1 Tax=Citrus clementina TaxID=85681 RepID=UPI000CED199D|nr:uncharacterized protein LOC18053036 [Citrus x clementina]
MTDNYKGHQHLLTFVENVSFKSECQVCSCEIQGTVFAHCVECRLDFHFQCDGLLHLPATIVHENGDGHDPLILNIETSSIKDDTKLLLHCDVCKKERDPVHPYYCCAESEYHAHCDINYHIQCGDPVSLPPTIVYEHHEHPLVLTETLAEDDSTLFYCYACVKERNPKHSFYFCAKCEYSTHVHCVITKVQLVERKKLKHFSHQHFLILQENGDVCYSACENFIQGASYGCDPCNYYLHQFCAALPKTLLHPYHQHHLPLQKPFVGIYRQCSACHKHGNGYMFSCVNCKFNLDVDCISLQRPSMKIESHEHIVTIFKKLHRSPKCICCNSASSNIIYLCCMRCNYIVHLWCAPLPKIIKHESHHYPLFITDYLFDKAYDEEVCDICEETRDQEECVYYCADCDFVAEFNCVMACLKGERGPVSLRTIDREITDKVIKKGSSLQDIYERN